MRKFTVILWFYILALLIINTFCIILIAYLEKPISGNVASDLILVYTVLNVSITMIYFTMVKILFYRKNNGV